MKKWIVVGVLLLLFAGCIRTIDERGGVSYQPDRKTIEAGAEGAATLLEALSPLFPPLGVAAAAITVGVVGYRKKIKPRIERAEEDARLSQQEREAEKRAADRHCHATAAVVDTIDGLKKSDPQLWAKIKPLFKKAKFSSEVKAVIQSLQDNVKARS